MAAPDVKVRITAEDNATATVVGLQQRFRAFRESSEEAGRGLNKVGNALGDMAREAVGASGPLGRIVEKVLEFGVGGGAFIVVAGAIALAYKAFEKLEESTSKAHKAYTDFLDSLRKDSPLAIIGGELDVQKQKLAEWEASTKGFILDAGAQAALDRQRETVRGLQEQYDGLVKSLRDDAEAKGGAVAKKARDDAQKALDAEIQGLIALGAAHAATEGDRARALTLEAQLTRIRDDGTRSLADRGKALQQLAALQKAYGIDNNGVTTGRGNMMPSDQGTNTGAPFTAPPDFLAGESSGPTQFANAFERPSTALKEMAQDLKNFGTGAQAAFDTAIEGAQAFGVNLGFVKKGLGLYAAVHGAYDEVLAISAFARGLFGDPSQFKAAATAQVSAARWFSLAAKYGQGSGGSGFAASGGGGGLSSNGFTSQQQAAQNRDKINIVLQKGYISSTDPDFQDWLASTLNNATGRGVQITVSGVAA